jgi:hypothetical protein
MYRVHWSFAQSRYPEELMERINLNFVAALAAIVVCVFAFVARPAKYELHPRGEKYPWAWVLNQRTGEVWSVHEGAKDNEQVIYRFQRNITLSK